MHDEAKPGVDVVFGLGGTSLPHDHAEALALAVAVWLPWLEDEPSAGIHPLRTAPTTQGMVLLARRARLMLRVPAHRAAASLGLSEKRLEVGEGLAIGGGEVKAFVPSPTLYSGRVASTARWSGTRAGAATSGGGTSASSTRSASAVAENPPSPRQKNSCQARP